MLAYSNSVYSDLQNYFFNSLQSTQCLIISGISFNDKAVNSRIVDWMSSAENRKMVIIHPEPERIKFSSRPAISRNLESWVKGGKLSFISKGLEDTNWDEVRQLLLD